MHVSRNTRWTACRRLFEQVELLDAGATSPAHRLDQAWRSHCGLRRADLELTLREMCSAGLLGLHVDSDGALVELRDRGAIVLANRLKPPGEPPRDLLARVLQRLETEWVLFRAALRTDHPGLPLLGAVMGERRRGH